MRQLALLLFLWTLPGFVHAQRDPDELLARAEGLAAKGRYKEAVAAYKRLARKHPKSSAGKKAKHRSKPSAYLGSLDLVRHGPSGNRVDVVLMGDGYTFDHLRAFDKLAEDIPPLFERETTFREYYTYFNFIRASFVSAEAGVDGFGREYDTALGAYTVRTDAGHVGLNDAIAKQRLDEVEGHDGMALAFVKLGVLGTSNRGIGVVGGRSIRTTIHEWGHAFGGLRDEYSTHTHNRGAPSAGVNISVSEKIDEVPWSHWLKAKVKDIGLYEGGSGRVRDVWRPTASGCIMNNAEVFCRVCREALILRIYSIVDPIDTHYPPVVPVEAGVALMLREDEKIEFKVAVLQPASHHIEVRWWLLEEFQAPRQGGSAGEGSRYRSDEERYGDRRDRGAYPQVLIRPVVTSKVNRSGKHTFVLKAKNLKNSGRYRVLCRAIDTTHLRGERWPWVLSDPHGLLESERGWWVDYRKLE